MPAAGDAPAGGVADLAGPRPPVPLHRHQREALTALEGVLADGHRRAWVVLPPGLGKTLTGLEAARRLGRPTVVFGPNTAIQGQWVAEWARFTPEPPPAGTDRDLTAPVTVLTYQALATFDPAAEAGTGGDPPSRSATAPPGPRGAPEDVAVDPPATAHLHRLRPRGRALVAALRAAGEVTLLLDECHHLLETWGELLAEVLRELPRATVIGLTATPPERLSRAQARLVGELFGPAVRGPSIPAAVRDGLLAPYAELAWLTTPTAEEADWVAAEAERFTELTTRLLAPGFASVPFLAWLDQRVVHRTVGTGPRGAGAGAQQVEAAPGATPSGAAVLPWHRFARDQPALADAALRFHHHGLLARPEGARLREEHRRPPDAVDWVHLLDDWVGRCLRRSADPTDRAAEEAIRAALPAVGYRLTAHGIRAGRSGVDRVLARSAAKSAAVRDILTAEATALDDRLRAVVVCDHEYATATASPSPAGQGAGPPGAPAGAARLVLGELAADPATAALDPLLVTGRTVAARPETARAFAAYCARRVPGLAPRTVPVDGLPGVAEVVGRWNSRRWVALATRYFEEGGVRALVGTRGLLGEGWNARRVTTLVDLTESTTPGAVVQTRGRALRLDPAWPEKTATTWSVVCVAPGHPRGATDWERFVRKHEGYLGVTAHGAVMSGVAHVDPTLSPYAPPPAERFAALNARMLARAAHRDRTRELWRIGQPYDDRLAHTVRVTPAVPAPADRGSGVRRPAPEPGADALPGDPPQPVAVPAPRGVRASAGSRRLPAVLAGGAGGGAALLTVVAAGAVPLAGPPAVALACWAGHRLAHGAAQAAAARAAAREPVVTAVAWAVADGLRGAGLTARGAEAVAVEPDEDGVYQLRLTHVTPAESERFATALDEALAPVAAPRYLLPRYVVAPPGPGATARALFAGPRRRTANAVVYHPVPAVLGENRRRVDAYAAAWNRRVSDGEPVYARGPDGAGLLAAQSGRSPLDVTTALRLSWS